MLHIVAVLLVLTAAFSYLNHRYLRWPMTIGVMAIALAVSLAIIGLDKLGFDTLSGRQHKLLMSIDFTDVLMQGMLSFLLFAGALHVDINQLRRVAWPVGVLALVGTAMSTLIIGYGSFHLLAALGIAVPVIYCLLFGALISPTDPIAVLGILKSVNVPRTSRRPSPVNRCSTTASAWSCSPWCWKCCTRASRRHSAQDWPCSPVKRSVAWRSASASGTSSTGCCGRSTILRWRY